MLNLASLRAGITGRTLLASPVPTKYGKGLLTELLNWWKFWIHRAPPSDSLKVAASSLSIIIWRDFCLPLHWCALLLPKDPEILKRKPLQRIHTSRPDNWSPARSVLPETHIIAVLFHHKLGMYITPKKSSHSTKLNVALLSAWVLLSVELGTIVNSLKELKGSKWWRKEGARV